ncbi:threonine-phosphate decarboxylase, partial [Burkholderia sp. BCCIQ04B]|nr:threonine-phosphate decarboxylase [Burkholderia anthinoferrum]
MSDSSIAHGGNLHEAARRHGIPYDAWLDLSTGINPVGYPVPPVPADAWRRLPDDGDGLAACAARYYHAPDAAHVLPVAGSQAAIRALPALLPAGEAGVAALAYGEYAPAFARHGRQRGPRAPAREARQRFVRTGRAGTRRHDRFRIRGEHGL